MPPRQRVPTAAMPKPDQYAYECAQCPPGPDGNLKPIYGGPSEADALAALEQHIYLQHTEFKAKVRFQRRPVPRQR